ncbi:unnamed protein product [Adineta ricciae]|uniref:Alpha-(1,6)-fucosyltransferase N- and catalytic domain-containing protein n=1 Tax=Adineta ricciae TaxID=249248 RepID=A0A815ILX7_ADIRI|nr:unnamed protein product [Adineta ricciae]CAF1453027.1 unnamed protein product [Adineta ricciae]
MKKNLIYVRKIILPTISFGIILFAYHHFYKSSYNHLDLTTFNKLIPSNASRDQQNGTYLWSLRLADENYFRIASLLACRTVEYARGSQKYQMSTCSNFSTNEFTIANTLQAQKWLFEHQHPRNCSNKRFAIIRKFAWSGFGSTIHQIVWAFGKALTDDRIGVYETPGDWIYGNCKSINPDCFFLPITNCSVPTVVDGTRTIYINANIGQWKDPVHPPVFRNRTFNWYRAQLIFYLMRYKPETWTEVQKIISASWKTSSIDSFRPFIAVYVRRSDKITGREMDRAFSLKEYFDLFDADARRANVSNIYVNSEDPKAFDEFLQLNRQKQGYYKLFSIKTRKNIVFSSLLRMPRNQRGQIIYEFLTDLFIEANADLHAGTLTSNWCRLVDEWRLTLGKATIYYTPEKKYLFR